MKTIIVYYSRKGNDNIRGEIVNLSVSKIEEAAKEIAKLTGGDLFEIKTVVPYAEDYPTFLQQAQQESQVQARPRLAGTMPDIRDYDVIYLGYPNWWGTAPMAVFTFLEQADFTGKVIKPFSTSEGNGLGKSIRDIQQACPFAIVKPGLVIRENDPLLEEWVR
ncbi:flavodoxin [Holdemania massiliensis]|uniref:flavodoxin n=1 Tax=Holdemania massiliensis TaxID=1468449 RepID=UPI001F0545EA|nr:flavodoxin [Holdemania massiliensis]MCH1939553.1 flavodoxin [Holdemania massiliensis]